RALLDDAKSNINDGKIKDGYNKLETARKESQEIVAASVKSYAAKKKEEAKNKIADTEEAISSLPQDKISANPQAKSSFQTATENVEAAKEALKSAEELYDQEKYQDSIKQSEEAIRLADIVVEQKDSLMAMLNKAPANTRSADIDGDDSDSSENSKAPGEGWKTYIVRKKVPSDCLWRIAGYKEHYGNPRLWTRIYKANKAKIKNPDLIYPKQKFDIPPKKGSLKKPKKSVNKPEEKRDKDLADTPKNSNGEESDDSLDSSSGDEESPKNN
ncbi:MAG: lipoprotein LipL71, partial [Leptospiraceae bacterium]|nr:lipoprotein LipL71 [Leptospiraceae bacterium]